MQSLPLAREGFRDRDNLLDFGVLRADCYPLAVAFFEDVRPGPFSAGVFSGGRAYFTRAYCERTTCHFPPLFAKTSIQTYFPLLSFPS